MPLNPPVWYSPCSTSPYQQPYPTYSFFRNRWDIGKVFQQQKSQQVLPIQSDIKAELIKLSKTIEDIEPLVQQTTKPTRPAAISETINSYIKGDINLKQLSSFIATSLPKNELLQLPLLLTGNRSQLPQAVVTGFTQLLLHIQQQPQAQRTLDALIQQIKSLPILVELKSAIDSAVASITSQQLIPLTRDADNPLLILFGLVIKDTQQDHLIQFRIEQENKTSGDSASSWSVTLNFEFQSLGKFQAKLHLLDNRIATVFHAEKPDTKNKIQQNMHLLETAFQQAGLEVVKLDVSDQQPASARTIPDSVHILDEQA